ncbi:hypothetical protein EV424DRAFT_1348898 [Suillus variegatus]|nr:hypothetical protein EV424DRAFT_1348898 [Suillus variegatus]
MPTSVLADSIIGLIRTFCEPRQLSSSCKACATPSLEALFVVNVALIILDVALCQAVIAICVWCLFARNRWLSSIFFKGMVHPSFTKSLMIFALVYTSGFMDHSALGIHAQREAFKFDTGFHTCHAITQDRYCAQSSFTAWVYKAASSSVQPLSLSAIRCFDLHLRRFTTWLLNHAELSRVQKTMGNSEDEISS